MHVEVKDRLPSVSVGVHDQPIAGIGDALALRELRGQLRHLANDCRIRHHARGRNVLAWNHEDVHRRLRIDVPERHALIRLGDERRRDLLASNAAEEARVGHCSSVRASGAGHESAQHTGGDHARRLEA
jgi:hypothetical protein